MCATGAAAYYPSDAFLFGSVDEDVGDMGVVAQDVVGRAVDSSSMPLPQIADMICGYVRHRADAAAIRTD